MALLRWLTTDNFPGTTFRPLTYLIPRCCHVHVAFVVHFVCAVLANRDPCFGALSDRVAVAVAVSDRRDCGAGSFGTSVGDRHVPRKIAKRTLPGAPGPVKRD